MWDRSVEKRCKLKRIISYIRLTPDDNIRHTLGIDSFDYLQFIIGLDEALAIQTAEEDYGKIETLRSLMDYIAKKKK